MTPDEEIEQLTKDWTMSVELMDGWRKRYDDEKVETARLRAALAEAERERDEARAELAVQDAISAMGAEWLVDLTSLRIKYERQRRTILALVVAARALRQAGWNWRWRGLTTDFMVIDVRARVAQIRLQEKLNSGQAGKE